MLRVNEQQCQVAKPGYKGKRMIQLFSIRRNQVRGGRVKKLGEGVSSGFSVSRFHGDDQSSGEGMSKRTAH